VIDRLLAILSKAGVEPDIRELRDTLWLSDHVNPDTRPRSSPLRAIAASRHGDAGPCPPE
jgi:hypothetical protein